MTSLTMILFICTGLGGDGATCKDYSVIVPPLVYEAICIKEPVTDSDWSVLDATLEGLAAKVDSPEFIVESIDCLGE